MDETGIVETVLWGVVGLEPARDCIADAFKDCIVPIWHENILLAGDLQLLAGRLTLKCARSSSFVKSESSRYSEYTTSHPYSDTATMMIQSMVMAML